MSNGKVRSKAAKPGKWIRTDMLTCKDYDAWLSPYNPQLKHFRPQFPTRDDCIAYVKERETKELLSHNPNVFRLKATDTESNQIIGYAIWAINDPETLAGDGTTHATWYPEGSEEREFAETFINGLWGFLSERVTRKHMGLYILPPTFP